MQNINNSDILAAVDILNQYKLGYVTKLGLSEALSELQTKLSKQTYLSKCGNYEYIK
mgnify:CR=1 FL=1